MRPWIRRNRKQKSKQPAPSAGTSASAPGADLIHADRNAEAAPDPDRVFSTIAEEWFSVSSTILKQSSQARYRNILDIQLLPEFGQRDISQITRSDVMLFSSSMLTSGARNNEGLSPKTVTSVLSVLKLIFSYANHVKGIPVADIDGLNIKKKQKQLRVFTISEQTTINNYLMEDITPSKLGILLGLYTGMRVGEICALSWGDISFDDQMIHVKKTMQRIQLHEECKPRTRVVITAPKSICSIRDIPIPEELFRIIKDLKADDDCFVLTGRPDRYIEPRTLENHFNTMTKTCGIQGATMHTCRHSFATRCVELGFDIKTLSEILGHASVSITMNRYVHPSMEMKQQNMDKLSSLMTLP